MLLFVGCGKAEPIRIGFIGSLTGASSDLSVSGYRGAEIAIEELNDRGGISGRKLELVVKDDQNDPEIARTSIKELRDAGVDMIVGPYTSGIAMAILESGNLGNGLLLGPTISADALSGKDDNFIRFIASTKEQATILAHFVKENQGKKTVVIYDIRNKGFSDQLMKNYEAIMSEEAKHESIEIPVDPSDTASFDNAVEATIMKAPDHTLILCGAEDFAKFAQRLKPHMADVQLLAPLWANTPQLIKKGGHHVDGVVVVSGFAPGTSSGLKTFIGDYEAMYGDKPTFSSLYTYETVMALHRSLTGMKNPTPSQVKERLIELKEFEGIQGPFSIDAYGDNTRPYFLQRIVNGRLNEVD